MKALLYKDWISFRWMFILLAGLIVFEALLLPAVGFGINYVLGYIATILFFVGIIMGTGGQLADLRTHNDRYLLAATVKKNTIITQRYLAGWVVSVMATLLLVGSMYFTEIPVPKFLLAALFFFAMTMMNSLTIPFAYLLGPEKAALPFLVIFMLLGFSGVGVGAAASKNKGFAQSLEQFFLNLADKTDLIAWGVFIAAIALSAASYFASLAIYRRKVN